MAVMGNTLMRSSAPPRGLRSTTHLLLSSGFLFKNICLSNKSQLCKVFFFKEACYRTFVSSSMSISRSLPVGNRRILPSFSRNSSSRSASLSRRRLPSLCSSSSVEASDDESILFDSLFKADGNPATAAFTCRTGNVLNEIVHRFDREHCAKNNRNPIKSGHASFLANYGSSVWVTSESLNAPLFP